MRWLSDHSALSKSPHVSVWASGRFWIIQRRCRESLRVFGWLMMAVLCGGGRKDCLDAR